MNLSLLRLQVRNHQMSSSFADILVEGDDSATEDGSEDEGERNAPAQEEDEEV
jgi:hypothetical protein